MNDDIEEFRRLYPAAIPVTFEDRQFPSIYEPAPGQAVRGQPRGAVLLDPETRCRSEDAR
jgi:hypothetical protein